MHKSIKNQHSRGNWKHVTAFLRLDSKLIFQYTHIQAAQNLKMESLFYDHMSEV